MTPYETAAADYRTAFGWPARALGTTVWLTPGIRVAAFNVPRAVGEYVNVRIELPVINIPGPPDRWSLLTEPHDGPHDEILNLLADNEIGYAYGPTSDWSIDLPPTRSMSWITPPDTPLPPADAIARAIARAIEIRHIVDNLSP